MKLTPVVFNRLIIALALATQLFLLASPAQAARNTNSPTIAQDNANHAGHNTRPSSRRNRRRCRERCQREYRLCQRGIVNPTHARCRQRYNQCLRSCGR